MKNIIVFMLTILLIVNNINNANAIQENDISYKDFGIYAYTIPLENFETNNIINEIQTLPFSNANYKSIFIYAHKLKNIPTINRDLPFYTFMEAWKNKPYFYYSAMKNNREGYCLINYKNGKYHFKVFKKNLVKKETKFKLVKEYSSNGIECQLD